MSCQDNFDVEKFKSKNSDIFSNAKGMLDGYEYQKSLTKELDSLDVEKLDMEMLYKIVLWKLNRFPEIDPRIGMIDKLKTVKEIKPGKHKDAQDVLGALLKTKGIQLPMASTFLRFMNPETFQIIDSRAFNVLYGKKTKKYPAKPANVNDKYIEQSIKIYFKYLDNLRTICDNSELDFKYADRVLYKVDIKRGNTL